MLRRFLAPIAALPLLAACATIPAETAPPPMAGTIDPSMAGNVSAADPRAEAAGLEILRQGGSATDAAIATMLALNVVEPQSSGIGGGGFMVLGTADGNVTTFDGREKAPAGAGHDWFLEDGKVPPFEDSVKSGLSVGVPGNIALAAKAHAEHGRLPWAALFQPAIRLAREGFSMNQRLVQSLSQTPDRAAWTEKGRALYFGADGKPLPAGSLIKNEELAQTFEAIASGGPSVFYTGPRAEALATTVAAKTPRPRPMTAQDLAAYEAKERPAVCGTYRGYRLCGMGPPTSGGIAILQMLGMLERFDLKALGPQNPVTWHLFLEAQRLAYADRELYLADSDFIAVPVEGLIDPEYLARRSQLIDPAKTLARPQAGVPAGAPTALADGDEPEEHGTSDFAAVNSSGTMVSYTSTIESAFGSGLMTGGFYLNNELTDFSRSPTVDGRLVANRVEGGKRPRSSMAPMVIWDPQGRPVIAVGAAGGSTIPISTARAIVGMIDFGMTPDEALALPFTMAFGDTILLEKGTWLEAAMPRFRALGHSDFRVGEAPIKVNALRRYPTGWVAGREPRMEDLIDPP